MTDSLEDIVERERRPEYEDRVEKPVFYTPLLRKVPGKYVPVRDYVMNQMISPGYNKFVKYRNNMRKR